MKQNEKRMKQIEKRMKQKKTETKRENLLQIYVLPQKNVLFDTSCKFKLYDQQRTRIFQHTYKKKCKCATQKNLKCAINWRFPEKCRPFWLSQDDEL